MSKKQSKKAEPHVTSDDAEREGGEEEDTTTAAVVKKVSTRDAEEIFNGTVDYAALSYEAFLTLLGEVTKEDVVRVRDKNRQLRRMQQEEEEQHKRSARIEPFLDTLEELKARTRQLLQSAEDNKTRNNTAGDAEEKEEDTKKKAETGDSGSNDGEDEGTAGKDGDGASSDDDDDADEAREGENALNKDHEYGYTYQEMLEALVGVLEISGGTHRAQKTQLPAPVLDRRGKRVVYKNFGELTDALHRKTEDVQRFIEEEVSLGSNLSATRALTMKMPLHKQTDFDGLIRKYIRIYVACNSCRSLDTTLSKKDRLTNLTCNTCGASRTVQKNEMEAKANLTKRSKQRQANQ